MVRDISGNPGNSVVQGGEQDKCAPCGTIRDNSMIWAGLFVVGRLYADSKLGVRVVPGTNGVNLANDRINQVNASLDEISLARALGRVHRVANEKSEFLFTTCPGPHLQHDELDPAPWLMRTTAGSKKKFRFFFNDVCGSNESWITQISEQTRTCTYCTGRLLEVGRAPKTRFIRFRSTNSTK